MLCTARGTRGGGEHPRRILHVQTVENETAASFEEFTNGAVDAQFA